MRVGSSRLVAAVAALLVLAAAAYFALVYYTFNSGLQVRVTRVEVVPPVTVHLNISNSGLVPVTVGSVSVSVYTSDGVLLCRGTGPLGATVPPGDYTITAVRCTVESGPQGLVEAIVRGGGFTVEVTLGGGVGPVSLEKRVRSTW